MTRFLERLLGIILLFAMLGLVLLLGTLGFFFALALVAVVAVVQFLRVKEIIGASRDSAFSFEQEKFRADAEHGVRIIETEYHVVEPDTEKKK